MDDDVRIIVSPDTRIWDYFITRKVERGKTKEKEIVMFNRKSLFEVVVVVRLVL